MVGADVKLSMEGTAETARTLRRKNIVFKRSMDVRKIAHNLVSIQVPNKLN
jgi:hypothetical protein